MLVKQNAGRKPHGQKPQRQNPQETKANLTWVFGAFVRGAFVHGAFVRGPVEQERLLYGYELIALTIDLELGAAAPADCNNFHCDVS